MLKASKNVQIIPISVLFVTDNQNLNSGSLKRRRKCIRRWMDVIDVGTYRRINGRNSSLDLVGSSGPKSSAKQNP